MSGLFHLLRILRSHLLRAQLFITRKAVRVRAWRAWLEVIVLQIVILLSAPLFIPVWLEKQFYPAIRQISFDQYVFLNMLLLSLFYSAVSAFWLAVRWRLYAQGRGRLKQFFLECLMTGLIFGELVVTLVLANWNLGMRISSPSIFGSSLGRVREMSWSIFDGIYHETYISYLFMIMVGGAALFFALRLVFHLLGFWNRLRRRQLRWALTHAHIMILVWGAVVVYFLVLWMVASNEAGIRNSSLVEQFLTNILLIGLVFLFLMLIGIVFVLPPSAIFSFFFSRNIVRRIGELAQAASAFRAGAYSVRVKVDGEDEIAHLQTDFNAMADDLERTLHALQEERDTVSTLLQARRELIASVSHELRTPVATVRSYLESTLSGWNEGPPATLHQDLQAMEQQVIRLQSLINDLFTLARAEVGRLEVRNVPVNVDLLVQRVVDTMAPVVWRGSRVEVVAQRMGTGPVFPRVLGDENRLEQILQNLLHNAVRHTQPGGIIVVSVSRDEQAVILQVKDTGEGISPEDLERIWERFYRATNARNRPGSNAGLGLAIVKELTEAMGGTVSVSSVLGEGSTFTIRLPRIGTGLLSEDEQQALSSAITDRLVALPKPTPPPV